MASYLDYPDAIEELIGILKQLPGIGRRGAERLALVITNWEPEKLEYFGKLLETLPSTVGRCPECGALSNAGGLCPICSSPSRDRGLVCVVETMAQLFAIESSGRYHGRYFVLGGKLSPLESENGDGLNLAGLKNLANSGQVQEIILALSSDVEGRATAIFLSEFLQDTGVRISQPAVGLPAGANLSYADGATIAAAFSGRTILGGGQL